MSLSRRDGVDFQGGREWIRKFSFDLADVEEMVLKSSELNEEKICRMKDLGNDLVMLEFEDEDSDRKGDEHDENWGKGNSMKDINKVRDKICRKLDEV